jgi:hypothetical protein
MPVAAGPKLAGLRIARLGEAQEGANETATATVAGTGAVAVE